MLGRTGTSTAESSEAPLSDYEVGIVVSRPFLLQVKKHLVQDLTNLEV